MDPEEEAVKVNLQAIGRSIQSQLPGKHWGYVVLAFPFGTGGNLLYLANANRNDALQAMREFIAKNTANPQAFTDQGENTNPDYAFEKWWAVEEHRISLSAEQAAQTRQIANDAFIAGMVWSPEE